MSTLLGGIGSLVLCLFSFPLFFAHFFMISVVVMMVGFMVLVAVLFILEAIRG